MSWCSRVLLVLLVSSFLHESNANPPPTPTNLVASDVTETSVHLQWNVNGSARRVRSYTIYYKVKDEDGGFIELPSVRSTGRMIDRLQPGTRYVFQVASRGDGGISQRSIPVEAITGEMGS